MAPWSVGFNSKMVTFSSPRSRYPHSGVWSGITRQMQPVSIITLRRPLLSDSLCSSYSRYALRLLLGCPTVLAGPVRRRYHISSPRILFSLRIGKAVFATNTTRFSQRIAHFSRCPSLDTRPWYSFRRYAPSSNAVQQNHQVVKGSIGGEQWR